MEEMKRRKKKKSSAVISFKSIFMHADKYDMALMGLGLLGAIGDGVSMPVMLLVTSKLMNSFGTSQLSLSENFTHSINKVSFFLLHRQCPIFPFFKNFNFTNK